MSDFDKPLFLKIENNEQLTVLEQSLATTFDMENDMALDDVVTAVSEIRELATLSDFDLRAALSRRQKATDERLNRLLATINVQNNLQNVITEIVG